MEKASAILHSQDFFYVQDVIFLGTCVLTLVRLQITLLKSNYVILRLI